LFLFKKNIRKDSSDEALMALVLKGNKIAFELLYERYFSKMVWYANSFLNDIQSAEDAVQEVFIKIIQAPEKFDINRTFSTWIYHVTANLCKNKLRQQKLRSQTVREQLNDSTTQTVQPNHEADMAYLQQILKDKFESLSEKERQIFTLRFEQQLPVKEIAAILEIPEGSVKSGIYYLLKKYAHILNYYQYEK
jgi:RNA polymerase sigma-70 factor (ECF subfamily)